MSDQLPSVPGLKKEHVSFLIQELAENPNKLLEIKDKFSRFFGREIKGELVQQINIEFQEQIKQKRLDIYEQVNTIPIAHSYSILALAQSRIEELLKTPKFIKTKITPNGDGQPPDVEDIMEIDDQAIYRYMKLCQDERFLTLRLEIEQITKQVDKNRVPKTGFKPIVINTGFTDGKEE